MLIQFLKKITGWDDVEEVDLTEAGYSKSDYPQWLSINFTLRSEKQFGDNSERKQIQDIGEDIEEALTRSSIGVYDGHEFGEGTGTLYVLVKSADKAYKLLEDILKRIPTDIVTTTLYYTPLDEEDVIKKTKQIVL